MKPVSSEAHPLQSLLGELRALVNRSLSTDVVVLDARTLQVWASASGDGLLMDAAAGPAVRGELAALQMARTELLEALRDEQHQPGLPAPAGPEPSAEGRLEPHRLAPFEVVDVLEADASVTAIRARLRSAGALDGVVVVRHIQAGEELDKLSVETNLAFLRDAGQLKHPNVVQVLDVGVDEDSFWLVTEDLQGDVLSEMVRRVREAGSRDRLMLAAGVVAQVADGLHAIHEQRDARGELFEMVHGQFTPDAAVVTPDGRVKLLPLRMALYARDPGNRRTYMAPEQLGGAPADRHSDVYALGVLLCELAAGPACGVPLPSAPLTGVPAALESALRRALREDAGERFQTAAELSEALRDFLREAGVPDAERPVRQWWHERQVERESLIRLDMPHAVEQGVAALRHRALEHLRENAALDEIARGNPVHMTHESGDFGYIAQSFGRLYLLVLLFAGPFEAARADAALKRSWPRVQGIVSAIAAQMLS